jgi:hypothetical protein
MSGVSRELHFMHIAVFTEDAGIFALARDERTNEVTLFLIKGDEEKAFHRDSTTDHWQILEQENLASILQSICRAVNKGFAIVKVDGKSDRIINRNN